MLWMAASYPISVLACPLLNISAKPPIKFAARHRDTVAQQQESEQLRRPHRIDQKKINLPHLPLLDRQLDL